MKNSLALATVALLCSFVVAIPPSTAATSDSADRTWYVAPNGRDAASGSKSEPLATVQAAINRAQAGDTVMLRGGTYHQSAVMSTPAVTLRSYPHERVWFDGASTVTGFQRQGSVWVKSGWTTEFDHSPTFTQGAPDNTAASWQWINPAYPMAAWPDQVWVDGRALRQVATASQVHEGDFAVDYDAQQLIVGTDPTGRLVEASTLQKALSVRGEGDVLLGFGVRRYANSVPIQGVVTLERPRITVRNVTVTDNAASGLLTAADDLRLIHVRVTHNGLVGIHGPDAYHLLIDRSVVSYNNAQHFNQSPVSGGVKLSKSRDVTIRSSLMSHNDGPGVWLDESCYDGKVLNNRILDNAGYGISLEISDTMLVANNLLLRNRGFGIKVNNTGHVGIWNNTFVNDGRPVNVVQDKRLASNLGTPGHDKRRPAPDPTVPWIVKDVRVSNNVISDPSARAGAMVWLQDATQQRTAAQMGVSTDGNAYYRRSATTPSNVAVWPSADGRTESYKTLRQFHAASSQERHGLLSKARPVDASGHPARAFASIQRQVARRLPRGVARAIGVRAGARHLGVYFRRL